jgi:hypothetical protein
MTTIGRIATEDCNELAKSPIPLFVKEEEELPDSTVFVLKTIDLSAPA